MFPTPPKLDWIYLPIDVISESLWACLHDGNLLIIRSDMLERTVVLEVDVPHVRGFHALGEETRFIVTLHGVESARVTAFVAWPGPAPDTQGKPSEEQNRLVEEYQSRGREESIGWNDFVSAFPANVFDIYTAEIARDARTVSLHLQGTLTGEEMDDKYIALFIRSQQIYIRQSDGRDLTLEQFVQLGEDYWKAWSAHE